MGRRPRSRATRAERRMQKERAASALAHGLPVPTPPPARARSSESSSSRPPSSAPPLSRQSGAPPGRRMPLAVKLLAAGIGLLGALYGLTVLRDHKDVDAAHASAVPESQAALAPLTSPSSQVAAASVSASAAAPAAEMPLIAKRVKAVVDALHARKSPGAQPDASAGQPNVAAALIPVAPVGSAVK